MDALAQRQWCNLGLLVLVILLTAIIIMEPFQKTPPATTLPLLPLNPNEVKQIRIERPQQSTLAFERRNHRWQMSRPEHGRANPILIDAILRLGEIHCPLHYAVTELNLEKLHLKPPGLQLWINQKRVLFSAITSIDGQRYLQVGKTVYLCPDVFYPLLTSAASSFLAPPPEPAGPPATTKVE